MAILYTFRCCAWKSIHSNKVTYIKNIPKSKLILRGFCTYVKKPKLKNFLNISFLGVCIGVAVGASYALKKVNSVRQNLALEGTEVKNELLKTKPDVKLSRKVKLLSLYDLSVL